LLPKRQLLAARQRKRQRFAALKALIGQVEQSFRKKVIFSTSANGFFCNLRAWQTFSASTFEAVPQSALQCQMAAGAR
jgi:hypothetical protein